MDQHKYREQHYKKTEDRVKVLTVVLRFFLNLLLITVVGTVTVFANATTTNRGALLILGFFATLVVSVICAALYFYIESNINKY